MSKELLQKFDKLRSMPYSGYEGLAEFFQKEELRFAAKDFSTWTKFFLARFGRTSAIVHAPEWLVNVFCELAQGVEPKSICDPWAGTGFLVEALREACRPRQALAFTQYHAEYELGKILVPEVGWRLGEPLHMLDSLPQEIDLVTSILPMGMPPQSPLKVTTTSGKNVELKDDLGNLVLVAASLRLTSSGTGLFVVTPSFFLSTRSSFSHFGDFGIGVEAVFSLPPGTFAPHTTIPAYLVVVRRKTTERIFVAQLSADMNTNLQTINNFRKEHESGSLELGRFVKPEGFKGIEHLRGAEMFAHAERRLGAPAVKLDDLAISINLGRHGDAFCFQPLENAIYVPLIGNSDVMIALDDLTLKAQNYAQVVIDPARSNARFVAQFLNSDFGKEFRKQTKTGFIPKLNKQTLKELWVFVPDREAQQRLLAIEAKIASEQTTIMALQNELAEFRREIWTSPKAFADVERRLDDLAKRLSSGVKQHASDSLAQWFETLPFPLASILRAWQATPSHDFKTKHEHLLHFFEATAELLSVILLSAFSSNDAAFASHRQKLATAMQRQNLSFRRATFGTWKFVVEYLGKQTRYLISENGKKSEEAKNDRALCGDMFADVSLSFPAAVSRKELIAILSSTNKLRNDWSGHGGVVGQQEAELRNQLLLIEVEKLRETIADTWAETHLIHALHCRPRRGQFENEIAILMGSNSEFLKDTRTMTMWLDVERLYLVRNDSGRTLKLLPLVQVGPSPQSAKNACYFFNRLERDGARFISYHFADQPELKGQFADARDTINLLSEVGPEI